MCHLLPVLVPVADVEAEVVAVDAVVADATEAEAEVVEVVEVVETDSRRESFRHRSHR